MYQISYKIYREMAIALCERIGCGNFFSGSIEVDDGEFYHRLTTSAIISRRTISMPDGQVDAIHRVTPVWWDCVTIGSDGVRTNDFSFELFAEAVVNG